MVRSDANKIKIQTLNKIIKYKFFNQNEYISIIFY